MSKYQFIWSEGVLGYGGTTSLGMIAMHYIDHRFALTFHSILEEITDTVPLFLLCGYLFGEMMWRWKARKTEQKE
ncbi:hypothetical protein [Paenibacillus kyungheensis]